MNQNETGERPSSRLRSILRLIQSRLEIVVAIIALLTFRSIASSSNTSPLTWQYGLIYGMALLYMGLILWKPMQLPPKPGVPFSWSLVVRGLKIAAALMLGGAILILLPSWIVPSTGRSAPLWFGLYVILGIIFGGLGIAAEKRLPIDLLPVVRRREPARILYVLAASFFLAILAQLWSGLTTDILKQLAQGFGEGALNTEGAAAGFETRYPLILLLKLMIGAGLFEEIFFRLGILTAVWAITRRFSLGLLFSALVFGLYHVSPLSGISDVYLATPITAIISSAMMGIFMGLVYRYRGLTAAVCVHGLGDWVLVMLLAGG